MTYDGLGRAIAVSTPDGQLITTDYHGLSKVVTDQLNHSATYQYDTFQRMINVWDSLGTQTEYIYDTPGNLIQVNAAKNRAQINTTTMTYDSLSKKRTMNDPDMGSWNYAYDKMGNLLTQTDAKGQTTSFTYDGLSRVTQKTSSSGTITYTYDNIAYSKGKLTKVTNSAGEDRILSFDVMQRPLSSEKQVGTRVVPVTKTYDKAGRVTTLTYFPGANQRAYTYTYNSAGFLLYVQDSQSRKLAEYSSFTSLGQAGVVLYANSVKTESAFTPQTGRLATLLTRKVVNGTPVATYQNLSYGYDGKGNVTNIIDAVNSITHTYTYDVLDRLTQAQGTGTGSYTQTFAYDYIGNITSKSDVGSYAYTYSNKPHAVRTAGNISLQYDNNGNMTTRAVAGGIQLDISYDTNNMPVLIKKNSVNYLSFAYDGANQRIKKENLATGNITYYYGEIYEERGDAGVIHVFAGNQRIVSIRSDGIEQYYHPNHLGSASVITGITGDRKESIEYMPFGTYRQRTDDDPSTPNVNYTFTDQEDDDETGLYNYKSRLYDPVLGRFITPDSIVPQPGNLQSLNRYSYCVNNPVKYVDPSGNFWFIPILIAMVVGAIVGAVAGAVIAAINGGNILQGALTGAISGALVAGGGAFGFLGAVAGGALAGATNAGITGGNIGQGAMYGAIGAAAGSIVGGLANMAGISGVAGTGVSIVAGGVIGGGITALAGGNFGQGFVNGMIGAGVGMMASAGVNYAVEPSDSEQGQQQVQQQAEDKTRSDLSPDLEGKVIPTSGPGGPPNLVTPSPANPYNRAPGAADQSKWGLGCVDNIMDFYDRPCYYKPGNSYLCPTHQEQVTICTTPGGGTTIFRWETNQIYKSKP